MIIFTHSVMGGGKTALLINKKLTSNRAAVVLKPGIDDRDGDEIVRSRNGAEIRATPIKSKDSILELKEACRLHQEEHKMSPLIILIDEAQFLTREQVNGLLRFSLDNPKIVIECFGLLVDFSSNLFEGSKRLIEIADKIESLTVYADDGEIATQNMRLTKDSKSDTIVLGSDEIYQAVSNRRFFKEEHDGKEDIWN